MDIAPSTKQTGRLGEQIAKEYLEKNGYEILDRNYVFKIPLGRPIGEVDIIAKKNGTVVFVEVKALTINIRDGRDPVIRPEEKANIPKRRRLIKTAENWLAKRGIGLDTKWQIDIIAVEMFPDRNKIDHFQNAVANF